MLVVTEVEEAHDVLEAPPGPVPSNGPSQNSSVLLNPLVSRYLLSLRTQRARTQQSNKHNELVRLDWHKCATLLSNLSYMLHLCSARRRLICSCRSILCAFCSSSIWLW